MHITRVFIGGRFETRQKAAIMAMEAEIGVIRPQTKECWQSTKARKGKKNSAALEQGTALSMPAF